MLLRQLFDLSEAGFGGEITGQYAPTNGLLKPEYDPAFTFMAKPYRVQNDQHTDISRLDAEDELDAADIVPGEGRDYADDEIDYDRFPGRIRDRVKKN